MTDQEEYYDAPTDYGPLTQQQAENIADLAARRAEERMYAKVGRSIVGKAIWVIGTGLCALAVWLVGFMHMGAAAK